MGLAYVCIEGTETENQECNMSFGASGLVADDSHSFKAKDKTGQGCFFVTADPGINTFTAKYREKDGKDVCGFTNRKLFVVPAE